MPGGDVEAWRKFLLLLGRAPDAVRAEGGIARLWATTAGRHVELREIDYAEVLRERDGRQGRRSGTESSPTACRATPFDLDDEAMRELLEIAGDAEQARRADRRRSTARAERRRRDRRHGPRRCCACSEASSKPSRRSDPSRLEPVLRNMAAAVGQLSPDMLVDLLSNGAASRRQEGPRLIGRRRQPHVGQRRSRGSSRATCIDAPARRPIAWPQAFQALVQDDERPRAPARARARRRRRVAARQHRRVRRRLGPGRREAADLVLRQAVRLGRVRTRAVERAHAGDRGRAGQRRPAGAHERLAWRRSRRARCGARPDARARPAAHRGGRRALGRR